MIIALIIIIIVIHDLIWVNFRSLTTFFGFQPKVFSFVPFDLSDVYSGLNYTEFYISILFLPNCHLSERNSYFVYAMPCLMLMPDGQKEFIRSLTGNVHTFYYERKSHRQFNFRHKSSYRAKSVLHSCCVASCVVVC